jgi:hypothetical protein
MSGIWFPLAATAAAGTVTYFTCVLPMLRGRARCTPRGLGGSTAGNAGTGAQGTEDHSAEIRGLREEVLLLAHEIDLREERVKTAATPTGRSKP